MYYRNGYTIIPSNRKYKKYDVYKAEKYITSFGDLRYEQYYDKFGFYSKLNHLDKDRRQSYRQRHTNDNIDDPNYAGYWSWRYLW